MFEEILSHWDFVVAVVIAIAGYVDIRNNVKESIKRLDKNDEIIMKVLERLEANDKSDAVRDEQIKALTQYKDLSNTSKDDAMTKLSKIETLVEQLVKQNDERHKEYMHRITKLEDRVYSN